ncbi:hypothetical protein BRADI_2g33508v3 [Brachypodium distachyon]|uniref:Uncharacterized protein n=1 Tax=Brachypodium distachyon TaxID=15368 RepID=A0A2K2DBL9_BRADI|nr:hypothetical protein BRADI_2g33508v3 [Brachypodium distachyon]
MPRQSPPLVHGILMNDAQRRPSMTPSPSAQKGTSHSALGLSPRILPPVYAAGDEERAMSMPAQLKDSQTTGLAQARSVPLTLSLLGAAESMGGRKIKDKYKAEEQNAWDSKRRHKKKGHGGKTIKEFSNVTQDEMHHVPDITGLWEDNRPDILIKNPYQDQRFEDGSYFVAREFDRVLLYYPGRPMVTEDSLRAVSREMQEVHQFYMQPSAGSEQHAQQINVRIPKDYGFFDQETGNIQERRITFGVEFNELFHLFNRQKLDINLLRLWSAYQIRELRRLEVKKVAILDPVLFNYGDIGLEPKKDASRTMTSKYLVACLEKYADDDFILFFLNLE